jgi:hypothetical protein
MEVEETAILVKVPKSGTLVYPDVTKFLEWEQEKIKASQIMAISLIEKEYDPGKSSNSQNLPEK